MRGVQRGGQADPIAGSYVLEVGSAGLERELKRPSDFARFLGETAEVRLYQPLEGSKSWVGKLAGYDDGAVTLETAGRTLRFEKNQVAQVRLRLA